MQISRWGNSLAVRLPSDLVKQLGLREGDTVQVTGDNRVLTVRRQQRPGEVLKKLRAFRGKLRSGQRLRRDEANAR